MISEYMKTTRKTLQYLFLLLTAGFALNAADVAAQQKQATIYVVKKQSFGAFGAPNIMINDVQVGKLSKESQYYECSVLEGSVKVSVLYQDQRKDLDVQVKEGNKYYVCADIRIWSRSQAGNSAPDVAESPTSMDDVVRAVMANKKKAEKEKRMNASVNLTRLNSASGEEWIKKCKHGLLADMTEYTLPQPTDAVYADNTPRQVVVRQESDAAAEKQIQHAVPSSDVDINIPKTAAKNENTFVLIIANENYEFVDNVEFALNDGEIFREYCIKTLGVPERQVWFYKNASLGIIAGGVDKMVQAMNIFDNAKAIVYYCGHGIPDEKTSDAYLVPVDGRGTNTATCYSLNQLYKTMASAKTSNVTYFMDACFTGANRDGSMLVAARGVAREAKKEVVEGNTVVFSAASGDETAMPFKEKGHGLFTYFLLKKLQETKGDVTYGELAEYINKHVTKEAFLTNEKPQNPVVATSEAFAASWKNVRLK